MGLKAVANLGGGGGGTVTGTGTPGTLAKFATASSVGDSVVTESAGAVTITGSNALRGSRGGGGVASNFAAGDGALTVNTIGNNNTAVGAAALAANTTGSNNTAVGVGAGGGITTGTGNTILGALTNGLAAGLTNNIILANGTGAIKAQHDDTKWSLTGNVETNALFSSSDGTRTFRAGVTGSTVVVGSASSHDLLLQRGNVTALTLGASGAVTFAGNLTSSAAQTWTLASSTTALNIASNLLNLDTTNSRVGIGTASPTDRLTISGGGLAITGNITGAATAANSLVMDSSGGTARLYSIGASAASFGNYVFYVSKSGGSPGVTPACTIDQAAGVLLGSTATAVFNASTSGQGVKLATTPANTDPNTLDAYFEAPAAATAGTGWTPTLSAAGTWGGVLPVVTYARYVRVGSIVFVHVQLSGAALTVAAFGGATISMPTGIAINTYANQGVVTTNTDNGASGTGVAGAGNIYSPAFAACTRATFQFFYFTN